MKAPRPFVPHRLAVAVALALSGPNALAAVDCTVSEPSDDGTGKTTNSLSWAVMTANNGKTPSTPYPSGHPGEGCTNNTITLTTDVALTGVMRRLIDSDVTLQSDSTTRTISGDKLYRPLFVKSGTVAIKNLNMSMGQAKGGDGGSGGGGAGLGGALFVYDGTVTVENVRFGGNYARGGTGQGGGGSFGGGGMFGYSSYGGGGLFEDGTGYDGGYSGTGAYGGYGGAGNPAGPGGSGGFGGGGGFGGPAGSGGFGGGGGSGYGGDGGFGGGGGTGGAAGNGGFGADGARGRFGGYGGGDGDEIGGGGGAGFGGAVFVKKGTLTLKAVTFEGSGAVKGTGANNGQGKGGAVFVCTTDLKDSGTVQAPTQCGGAIDETNSCGVAFSGGVAEEGQPDLFWTGAAGGAHSTVELAKACASTTTVASDINPSTVGQSIAFTATVNPNTATGTVAFKANGTDIGGCTAQALSGGSATCATQALNAAGSPYTITAIYSGDSSYAASSGALSGGQTVNKGTATVVLGDLDQTYDGAPKSATCATTPGGLTTGITYDGGTTSPRNAGSYTAVCTISDTNWQGSDTQTFTIAKAEQTITFNPPAAGIVSGSATLSATGGNSGNPVTFASQTASVCAVSGTTINYLAAGTCTVRASQAGDANHNPAPDVVRNIMVNKADQTITFNPPASGTVGGNSTLSATGGNSGNPVTFNSQTTSVCTVAGSAVNYLAAGTCTVRASQAGDTNYNPAPDADRNIAVGATANTTTLASSANPSTFGQPVTFTATVAGQNPTGAVAFGAEGNPLAGCASVALTGSGDSKTAACTTAALTGGTHPITAAYGGDANNQPSEGSLQQVVQNVFTGPSATGQGAITATFSGGGNNCNLTQTAFVTPSAPPPAGYTFPYGLLRFALGTACDGSPVTVQVTYPAPLPAGAVYWKYGKTQSDPTPQWYEIPAAINGATATFTLTDGGLGDDDLAVNGRIADDGGAGVPSASPVADIPTLSEWALLMLAGLLGLFGMRRVRRA